MAGLSGFQVIWIVAGAVVVLGWLIISFTAPSNHRTIVEWLSATAMYVGLEALFVHLVMRAQAADNLFALIAFGFLCVLFGGGLLVSSWHMLTSLGGTKAAEASATN